MKRCKVEVRDPRRMWLTAPEPGSPLHDTRSRPPLRGKSFGREVGEVPGVQGGSGHDDGTNSRASRMAATRMCDNAQATPGVARKRPGGSAGRADTNPFEPFEEGAGIPAHDLPLIVGRAMKPRCPWWGRRWVEAARRRDVAAVCTRNQMVSGAWQEQHRSTFPRSALGGSWSRASFENRRMWQ